LETGGVRLFPFLLDRLSLWWGAARFIPLPLVDIAGVGRGYLFCVPENSQDPSQPISTDHRSDYRGRAYGKATGGWGRTVELGRAGGSVSRA
jgi:hypothetical protein